MLVCSPAHLEIVTRTSQRWEQLALMVKQQAAAGEVAAVLVEPVLGEGGYVLCVLGSRSRCRPCFVPSTH